LEFSTLDPAFDIDKYEKEVKNMNFNVQIGKETCLLPNSFVLDNKHSILSWEYGTDEYSDFERISVDLSKQLNETTGKVANYLA